MSMTPERPISNSLSSNSPSTDSPSTDSPSPQSLSASLDESHVEVLRRMGESVGVMSEDVLNEDAFVGFFQSFRPDGRGVSGIFETMDWGDEIHERLESLFEVAGDDRRPGGGRDAYFIVRRPAEIDPDAVQHAGERWIAEMGRLAESLGHSSAAEQLAGMQRVRVLEGIPPKHPKNPDERTELLTLLSDAIPGWLCEAAPELTLATTLRSPFYYVNCDAMLRDYLMWPMYRDRIGMDEPFEAYFRLWRHGVKWRVFQETQIDLYMPRF